ncbi:hypothetical protein [Salinithrix halophila]|uniref:Uncharacterized protein n=1 Tax=Salinithrix halophila TaxID=1485204 RepID=A0ABV8JC45_9BACL
MTRSKKMLLALSLSCVLAVGVCYEVLASTHQYIAKMAYHDEPKGG